MKYRRCSWPTNELRHDAFQRLWLAPIGGRHSVEYIVACFVPDAIPMLVQQIFPPLLVAPSAVFVQRANGTHDMKVRIGNAGVLFVWRVNGKVHHIMPRLTKFSNKNCLARAIFSCMENSFCKAMSKLYASCAFFPRSAFSTAFQRVSRSAYSDGA